MESLDRAKLARVADDTRHNVEQFQVAIAAWANALKLDQAKGPEPVRLQPWQSLRNRWTNQLANLDQLRALVGFNQIAEECRNRALNAIVDVASTWEFGSEHLVSLFERCRLSSVLQVAFMERPCLASFDGADHLKVVEEFRRLDRLQLEHSRVWMLPDIRGLSRTEPARANLACSGGSSRRSAVTCRFEG